LDAPESFRAIGKALSFNRRNAAESGLTHVTARKLGALFEDIIPDTPKLVDSYGVRASEIAEASMAQNPVHSNTMFTDQIGIEATSIWAAATSGKGAIAVHLLACMLARIWSGAEATSIWAEMIDKRKKELLEVDSSDPRHFSAYLAAQVTLSRDRLAEWDNSARAWLRAADEAKAVQQTQLLLVIRTLNIPVNHDKGGLYQSVIAAWKRALELMESLLNGIAQRITPFGTRGELFLGLASWHLYPDLNVYIFHRFSC
jgi:hypothetical protein